jgi:RNA polymerase sigma-70 factor (ECF subfamily)
LHDKEFIDKLRNSDEESFKILVDTYSDKVLNLCFGFVRNTEDANDISQEVFIEIYFSIKKFREESSLSTWIYRIVVNKSLDFIKSQNRKKRSGIVFSLLSTDKEAVIPGNNNPENNFHDKQRIIVLKKAMDSLSENQRTALNLSSLELYSYEEIADIMKKSVSSVESLVFRAKKNLEKILKRYYKNYYDRKL